MPFELTQIVAKLVQRVGLGGKREAGEYGLVYLFGAPAGDHRTTAVQQHFQQAEDAGVVDFDAGIADRAGDHGQSDPLQQRKVDVNVQPLGLESGEPAGHREQLFAHRGEIVQAFLEAEIGQVVGACLIAQIGGELLVLLDEGVAIVGAKNVMPMFELFENRVRSCWRSCATGLFHNHARRFCGWGNGA